MLSIKDKPIEVGDLVWGPRYTSDGVRYMARATVIADCGFDGVGTIWGLRYDDGQKFVALDCEVTQWSPHDPVFVR